MSKVQWIITKDHLEGDSAGVRSSNFDANVKTPYPFKIYDDDGILYYEGYCSEYDTEEAFAPLDNYAQPNDGATEIHYKETGLLGKFSAL